MRLKLLCLCATALACSATAAEATVVTQTYTINASGFGVGAPVSPVVGSFTLTYDKDAPVILQTSNGLSIGGFNLPYDGTALYSYQKGGDFLTISDAFNGFFSYTLGGTGQKFGFTIMNLSTTPTISSFGYSRNGTIYNATNVTVTAGAVPEPATWGLMLLGFGGLGYSMRRKGQGSPRVRFA